MRKEVRNWAIAAAGVIAVATPASAQDSDASAVVAAQIRQQGFACDEPATAKRDMSSEGDAVWLLTCANGSYRVRLVPNQAASVEQLDKK